ncbi:Hypothetical predicted protein [Cloeon dipterum]|uniref:Hexosyltransferase n=1 Tax=Cloeon dipterum TaxID=197152 RepID=A0A8S1DX71_9INSE|nr:Hypothetical predicted protein [Cloeon dipterum]
MEDPEPMLYNHAADLKPRGALRMASRRPSAGERRCLRAAGSLLLGTVAGYLVAALITTSTSQQQLCPHADALRVDNATLPPEELIHANLQGLHNSSKSLLFVGVMTAQKYLDTRAKAVYDTWGRELPGRMAFFSSGTSETNLSIPLVALPGVDDSYPPQKKSFLMLKYMHEHFGEHFEWFLRADDDVYVRPDRLETFLRSIDSRKPQFIGQAGRGSQEEFGLLSLEYDENFCMGGPGVLMSRATLAKVAPHVSYCLRNLYTTHEDVELGRCVQKFAGIPCTWSYEMQTILYHNSSGSQAFTGRLKYKEVHRAITLHPVKQHKHLYRVHNYMRSLKIGDLQQRSLSLLRDIGHMSALLGETAPSESEKFSPANVMSLAPSLMKYKPKNVTDVIPWEFFTNALYSDKNANPRRRMELPLREGLDDVVREVMEMTNAFSRQRGRILDFKEVLYGYHHVNPIAGQELVLDMQLVYRKYRGRKMTIPVRRHTYLQRAFTGIAVRETVDGKEPPVVKEVETNSGDFNSIAGGVLGPAYALMHQPQQHVTPNPARDKLLTFLVPLSGRLKTFHRFISLYEEICILGRQATALVLVLFPSDEVKETVALVRSIQRRHPSAAISILPVFVPFARGMALQLGAAHVQTHNEDTILFFVDVDIVFTAAALQRIRLNTIKGKSVYFPIVFSEFDPNIVHGNTTESRSSNHFLINENTGYWRNYGFGIASAYPSDLNLVGGFNTAIKGWGKEDVDLFDKFVKSKISVFRAADPGLVHVFHIVECDTSLDPPQFAMCQGTRANTYGGNFQLSRILDAHPEILQMASKFRVPTAS